MQAPADRLAADIGTGEGLHAAAVNAAEGRGVSQDWASALDLLCRSAEKGHSLAQASLAALSQDWTRAWRLLNGEVATEDWSALKRAADVAGWLQTPPPKILSVSPRVGLVEAIASPEICDWLIA